MPNTRGNTALKKTPEEFPAANDEYYEAKNELQKLKEKTPANNEHSIETLSEHKEHSEVTNEVIDSHLEQKDIQSQLYTLGIDIQSEEAIEGIIDQYSETDDRGEFKKIKDFNAKNMLEEVSKSWSDTEEEFFLFRPFLFLKNLFINMFQWKKLKEHEKEAKVFKKYRKIKEVAGAKVEQAQEFHQDYRDVKRTLAENPQVNEVIAKNTSRMREALAMKGKVPPRKLAEGIKEAASKTLNDIKRLPTNLQQQVLEKVQDGKMAGMRLKRAGKYYAIEVFNRGILEAIEQKRFGAIAETIADSNIWFESLPIMGSLNSWDRFNIDNGDRGWIKYLDLGMNLYFDAQIVAGLALAIPTMGASLTLSAKGLLEKFAAKAVMKGGAKLLSKESVKAGAKKTGRAGMSLAKSQGWSVFTIGVAEALNKYFESGHIKQVSTKIAIDQLATPEEKVMMNRMGLMGKR